MKKNLCLLVSVLLLSFISCTNEVQELESQHLKQIVMTTLDFEPESGSRTLFDIADGAVQCTWGSNDTVGVFPDKGAQAYFPMSTGAGTKNATFDGEGWALKDGRTYGAYYPCIGKFYLDRHAVPVNYVGQTQTGNGSMAHLGTYDYMVATPTSPEFGSAKFMFKHLSALVQLKITVPQPATLTSVKLVTDTKAFAVEGKVDIMADSPSIIPESSASELELNLQEVSTTDENQVVTLYLMLPPVDLSEQSLKVVVASNKGRQDIDLQSKNFEAGKAYGFSGEVESSDAGYKDGVVTLAEAGTMKQLLGDDWLNITKLKVVGPINGDDVRCLRQMLGGKIEYNGNAEKGKLTKLDLSEASIVEGGEWYYKDIQSPYYKYTNSDVIGNYMFNDCENLKHIVLSDNITSIGTHAFSGCSSLASIDIPKSVSSIGVRAFAFCSSLITIDIPNGIKSISIYTFEDCSSLISVNIPNSMTSIGNDAFSGCSSLTSIKIPEGITSIENNTFAYCSSLASVDIPNSVTSIGVYAFLRCKSLNSIKIPKGVTTIARGAFQECASLTSIKVPDGITSISESAFSSCSSLTTINIPDGTISIGTNAFYNCNSLTTIEMPSSVTLIGSGAFSYCRTLNSVCITDLSEWCNINFESSGSNPLNNGAKLYINNTELTELVIPADIKQINNYAFHGCKSFTKVTVGDGVNHIGIGAFYKCSSLTSITMGINVKTIGKEAFLSCSSLTKVCCYATTPSVINTTNSYSSFDKYGDKTTLYVPKGCSSKYMSSWGNYFKNIKEME